MLILKSVKLNKDSDFSKKRLKIKFIIEIKNKTVNKCLNIVLKSCKLREKPIEIENVINKYT